MTYRMICLTSAAALAAGGAFAQDMNFNRIASFPVVENMAEGTISLAKPRPRSSRQPRMA